MREGCCPNAAETVVVMIVFGPWMKKPQQRSTKTSVNDNCIGSTVDTDEVARVVVMEDDDDDAAIGNVVNVMF